MIDNIYFARLISPSTKQVWCWVTATLAMRALKNIQIGQWPFA
jgi:hypothetical protein